MLFCMFVAITGKDGSKNGINPLFLWNKPAQKKEHLSNLTSFKEKRM